jgi:hypothetical protein
MFCDVLEAFNWGTNRVFQFFSLFFPTIQQFRVVAGPNRSWSLVYFFYYSNLVFTIWSVSLWSIFKEKRRNSMLSMMIYNQGEFTSCLVMFLRHSPEAPTQLDDFPFVGLSLRWKWKKSMVSMMIYNQGEFTSRLVMFLRRSPETPLHLDDFPFFLLFVSCLSFSNLFLDWYGEQWRANDVGFCNELAVTQLSQCWSDFLHAASRRFFIKYFQSVAEYYSYKIVSRAVS